MREIKFRALRNHTKQWVYGNLINKNERQYVVTHDYFWLDGHHLTCDSDEPVFIVDGTVGQHTGLKDKNSVEVYDGDIIFRTVSLAPMGEVDEKYQVLWQDFRFVIRGIDNNNQFELIDFNFNECEVIGNIHENPELMKG